MIPNFKEILSELSYRVDGGIPDLTKESHVNHLIDILRENGISDAAQLAQKARVYFSYLNEAKPKKIVGNDTTIVVNKKSGSVYPVKTSNFNASVHDKATTAQIKKAKSNGTFGKEEMKNPKSKMSKEFFDYDDYHEREWEEGDSDFEETDMEIFDELDEEEKQKIKEQVDKTKDMFKRFKNYL